MKDEVFLTLRENIVFIKYSPFGFKKIIRSSSVNFSIYKRISVKVRLYLFRRIEILSREKKLNV